MSYEYLDQLSLDPGEREKIVSLGADTAPALLGMMQAAPDAFGNFLGPVRAQAVAGQLNQLLSPEENLRLNQTLSPISATGAMVSAPSPPLPPPRYDIRERNRLFSELEQARRQEGSSPQTRDLISRLEQRLNSLLDAE